MIKTKSAIKHRRNDNNVKMDTFNFYGGCCKECGESNIDILSIDHINNDGSRERKNTGIKGGNGLYRKLRREGFPPGYQILCLNHNCGKML